VNATLTDSYPDAWWLTPSVLIKNGAGTMALTAANSYDGDTIVNTGTMRLGNGSNHTNLANASDVIVASGATLHLAYTGTDTIDELWLGGVRKSPGVYSSANSGGFITGSGTLTVSNGPPSDYDTWAAANDLIEGSQGDDDKDGASNTMEHAFGLNPKNGGSSNPYLSLPNPGTSIFTYTRRKTSLSGIDFKIWTSTNLTNWTEDTEATQAVTSSSGDSETVQVTMTSPFPADARFFIRITTDAH
jgi:autotransporter-associated beta strand protein